MKKKNPIILLLCLLIFSLIFQSTILFKLNLYENRILARHSSTDNTNSVNHAGSTIILDGGQDTIINPSTQNSNADSNDFQNIEINDDNMKATFENSLFIGNSRAEGLMKFTSLSQYSDFFCGVGYNLTNINSKEINISGNNLKLYSAISLKKYNNIFISLGFNELGWSSTNKFKEKFTELVTNIKNISPKTSIFALSILPVGKGDYKLETYENNTKIFEYNEIIKEVCTNENIKFINMQDSFIDSQGYLLQQATDDGIHLNVEYNKIFANNLFKILFNINE